MGGHAFMARSPGAESKLLFVLCLFRGWRASSAAGLQCKGSHKTSDSFSYGQSCSPEFQIEGLESHIQICGKSTVSQHCAKGMHACKNSMPQGLEETFKLELLKTDRRFYFNVELRIRAILASPEAARPKSPRSPSIIRCPARSRCELYYVIV